MGKLGKWRRLSLASFHFSKAYVAHVRYSPYEDLEDFYRVTHVYDLADYGCILFTDDKGVYRLHRKGECVCEGDEFTLACGVASIRNEVKHGMVIHIPVDVPVTQGYPSDLS